MHRCRERLSTLFRCVSITATWSKSAQSSSLGDTAPSSRRFTSRLAGPGTVASRCRRLTIARSPSLSMDTSPDRTSGASSPEAAVDGVGRYAEESRQRRPLEVEGVNSPGEPAEDVVDHRLDDRLRLVAQQEIQDVGVGASEARRLPKAPETLRGPVVPCFLRRGALVPQGFLEASPLARGFPLCRSPLFGVQVRPARARPPACAPERRAILSVGHPFRPAPTPPGHGGAGTRRHSRDRRRSGAVRRRSAWVSPEFAAGSEATASIRHMRAHPPNINRNPPHRPLPTRSQRQKTLRPREIPASRTPIGHGPDSMRPRSYCLARQNPDDFRCRSPETLAAADG